MESMGVRGKRILVTGGSGFIGSHLVKGLLKYTDNIVVASERLDSNSYFVKSGLFKQTVFEPVDITLKREVDQLGEKYDFDFIFHLAAQTIVTVAHKNPQRTFESNIMGTVNILELARSHKVKGTIVASSDKAYGKSKDEYTETTPLKGDHPYDVSKTATDLIAQTYFKTYGLPLVITRMGNVYGPGDSHTNRIFPGICISLATNSVLSLRSDGSYVRDYIYVDDVVNALIILMKKFETIRGEAFNISSDKSFSVIQLITAIEKQTKLKINYKVENTAKNEIPFQHLNTNKIKKLGWKCESSFKESVLKTLDWYIKMY